MGYILAVDDDPEIRDQLVELLQGKHFVQEAESGEAALEWLAREPEWHAVITDISMPGLSGLELVGRIRQMMPDTPVIVLSGLNDPAYKAGALGMDVFKYMTKPYRLDEIEASVDSAVAYYKELIASRRRREGADAAGPQRLYALSINTENVKSGESEHEADLLLASSVDEAKQRGFEYARQKWPMAEGWIKHSVIAKEAPSEIMSQFSTAAAPETLVLPEAFDKLCTACGSIEVTKIKHHMGKLVFS
ncbi:MAG TPA: response regulator [Pyrinomonadaceae bacterium]|nr:response regulator [Pyrinomonadaceae bacterium]